MNWLGIVSGALMTAGAGAQGGLIPNIYVWFEASGQNAQSSVLMQGGLGSDLHLGCDTSAGPVGCSWDVSMKMFWTPGTSESLVSSMATDFLGDTGKHSVSGFQPGDYPFDATLLSAINSGGVLGRARGALVPSTGPGGDFETLLPGEYTLLSARLNTSKSAGDLLVDAIDMRIDTVLWTFVVQSGPNRLAVVQFGDAPAVPGNLAGSIAEDVILVHNLPEPGAGMLMGAGVLMIRLRESSARGRVAARRR